MGGFVKHCRDPNMYFKMEDPTGHRIEELLVAGSGVSSVRGYRAAMLGVQGVPTKCGSAGQSAGVERNIANTLLNDRRSGFVASLFTVVSFPPRGLFEGAKTMSTQPSVSPWKQAAADELQDIFRKGR